MATNKLPDQTGVRPKKPSRLPSLEWYGAGVLLVLLVGTGLRLTGLGRGAVELPAAPQQRVAGLPGFYRFHPDEETVVAAALRPVDLRQPPFTVYGTLPVYLLRAVLVGAAAVLGWDPLNLERPESARAVFLTARLLAVAFSCATLWMIWRLGRTWLGVPAALIGTLIVALAPGAIQQAHFYIVDGLLLLLVVVTVAAGLYAVQRGRLPAYLGVGAAIGAAGAVRLSGLLLAVWLVGCHLAAAGRGSGSPKARVLRAGCALAHPGLMLAGISCLAVLLAFQPYLVLTPRRLLEAHTYLDFGLAVAIARLELLQPWTLVDLHTIRYWDHWWRLMPLIAGWPLAMTFPLVAAICLWQRTSIRLALLSWSVLLFMVIGAVPVKAVRYLISLLPFLALLTGAVLVDLLSHLKHGSRRLAVAAIGLVGVHLAWSGLAFSRIYQREDSRLQAAQWVNRNIPVAASIGIEHGGFSMRSVLDAERNHLVEVDAAHLFYTGPYMLEQQQVAYMGQLLSSAEWIVLTDVNRMRQYKAVPELFPVPAELYARLADGRLGYDLVWRFKEEPGLFGLSAPDDGAEPSFLGYDHPAVLVFKQRSPEAVETAIVRWQDQVRADPEGLDAALARTAEALSAGNPAQARQVAENTLRKHPASKLALLLQAEAAARLQAPDAASLRQRCRPDYPERLTLHLSNPSTVHRLPAATAESLLALELRNLALRVLREGANASTQFSYSVSLDMAAQYADLAQRQLGQQDLAGVAEILHLANRICPRSAAYNALAHLARLRREPETELRSWESSLRLSPDQTEVWAEAGICCAIRCSDASKARYYLEQACRRAPARAGELAIYLQALPISGTSQLPLTELPDRRTTR